ncbi:MAG: hypothetical protein R2881_10585 [Eubacteriales bacterium]
MENNAPLVSIVCDSRSSPCASSFVRDALDGFLCAKDKFSMKSSCMTTHR